MRNTLSSSITMHNTYSQLCKTIHGTSKHSSSQCCSIRHTDLKPRQDHPQDPPRQKKSFFKVSQCCRIKVSIVSNEGRSVVLNNIIMIVGHHLRKETPELLWKNLSRQGDMRQHFQEFVEHLPTHQQRLAHDKEKPHAEVASPWSKSLLQPFAQLHLEFRLLYRHKILLFYYQGSIKHKANEEPGFEHPQWDWHGVLVEKGGDKEDHCDCSATRPTCKQTYGLVVGF